jgi:hypothetical protein
MGRLAVVSGGRVCRVDGRLKALTTPAMDAAEFTTIVERTAPIRYSGLVKVGSVVT